MIVFTAHITSAYRVLAEINIEHLRELQRFAEVGRVSAGLIHDISSPLTAAILHLEQGDPQRLPSVRHARRSIRVLERYVEAARRQLSQEDRTTVFRVDKEMCQIKHILRPLARKRRIYLSFSAQVGRSCSLLGDPVKFQRIIINLVTNAMDAYASTDQTCKTWPVVKVALRTDDKNLIISVQDKGEGIDTEQMPHLFKPFYTTKQSGAHSGSGIGLSTVKQYAEEIFGGMVGVNSCKKKGTELRITLPLHSYDNF